MPPDSGLIALILCCGVWLSVKGNKLTIRGGILGGVLGFFIFLGACYTGLAMLGLFFILGTVATSWKMKVKQQRGIAEKRGGRRRGSQVLANGAVAGTLGLLAWLYPQKAPELTLLMAGSLSAATADTLSSELGNVYGRKFYNILTFKKEQRGLNGVISIEGTGMGIAGSALIALTYGFGFGWDLSVLWIIVAGTVGNVSDSILGATLERQRYLNNDAINFLNTLIGAFTALLLCFVFD